MSNQLSPQQDPRQEAPPPRSGGGKWVGCLVGCAAVCLVLVVVCGGLAWYVYSNAKSIATNAMRELVVEAIDQSEMSDDDKAAVTAQVDRVSEEYKAGNITLEQIVLVMQTLAESPLFAAAMMYAIEQGHVNPSDLPPAEKEQARLTLQRVTRGLAERTIDVQSLQSASDSMMTTDAQGNQELKQEVSIDELRLFLANLKQLADEAGIPEEPYELDIGAEFEKAVDKALAEG